MRICPKCSGMKRLPVKPGHSIRCGGCRGYGRIPEANDAVMETGDLEDEEAAWQRMRQAVLECQVESAQSETGEPSQLSRKRVRHLGDELAAMMERNLERRRRKIDTAA